MIPQTEVVSAEYSIESKTGIVSEVYVHTVKRGAQILTQGIPAMTVKRYWPVAPGTD